MTFCYPEDRKGLLYHCFQDDVSYLPICRKEVKLLFSAFRHIGMERVGITALAHFASALQFVGNVLHAKLFQFSSGRPAGVNVPAAQLVISILKRFPLRSV